MTPRIREHTKSYAPGEVYVLPHPTVTPLASAEEVYRANRLGQAIENVGMMVCLTVLIVACLVVLS